MRVYSPDIPVGSADFYINYPQILELTIAQSHYPGEIAAQFSAAVATYRCQFSFHLVLVTAGLTEAVWIQSLPNAFYA